MPERIPGPSNRPLLDALGTGAPLFGHVLVRRDGSVVRVEDAREADWLDLDAQLTDEPIGPSVMRLIRGGGEDAA